MQVADFMIKSYSKENDIYILFSKKIFLKCLGCFLDYQAKMCEHLIYLIVRTGLSN